MTFRHVFTHPAAHPLKFASTTEEIRTTCALDWQILETPVTYAPPQLENEAVFAVEDCKVLYRSDTLLPLAIVPSRFNPAQPEEIIDFYLRFAAHYSLPLVSAGCLQGGKLIWGLLQTGHHFELESRYHAWSHLLLSTRCDSSFAATLPSAVALSLVGPDGPRIPARRKKLDVHVHARRRHRRCLAFALPRVAQLLWPRKLALAH